MADNVLKTEDIYWRDKRISGRLAFALEHDKLYKDVTFIVGEQEERISAHKLILRLSSLIFENLITAHEEEGVSEIRLPNTSPQMFTRLLKFIYTDEIEIHDLISFLQVAKEFGFTKLTEQSLRVLKKTEIGQDNAIYFLDIGKALCNKELETSSLNYIVSHAKKVFNSPSFIKISYDGLVQIFREDRLDVAEMEVFKAAIKWAEYQCKRSSLAPTSENIQKSLGSARFYIRYTQMDYAKMLADVKPSGILTNDELSCVLKLFVEPTSHNTLRLKTQPRATRASKLQKLMSLPIITDDLEKIPIKRAKLDEPRPAEPPPEEDRTKEFRMYSTFIDYRELIESIQLRFTVTKVVLHDVIIQNQNCYLGRRVHLPNLETFYYCLKKEDPTLVVPTILPDKSFMSGLSTKDFLFFEKDRLVPWELKDLWGMGVDVLIHVKGLRLLDINHKTKSLTMSFPLASEASEMLRSLIKETELKSMCLTASNISDEEGGWVNLSIPDALTPTASKLTTLILQGVEFKNCIIANQFLNQFPNLKNLSIYIVNSLTLNFETDFTAQRNSLEKIAFSNVTFYTYKKKKDVVPFLLCEELYLDFCTWPPSLGDHFSLLFPKLKKIAIRSRDSCRCSARLFTEILEIRSLKSIAMYKYPGPEAAAVGNPNLNIFIPPSGVNKKAVKTFLKKAGMEFNEAETDVPDFILQKKHDSVRWNIVADPDNAIFDQMHFDFSMLDRFYDDRFVTKLVQ